jgi:hypothetical protein
MRRRMCQQRPALGCTEKMTMIGVAAELPRVRTLATQCALAQVRRIMEPGGVEPPCRDGRYTASTCVVAIYSRPAGRLATTFLQAIADKFLASQGPASPLKPVRSGVQCPIGRQSLNVAVKPRVRTGCCQLRFLHHLLTREKCIRDTQRHTFPARSMPVGPDGW